MSYDVLVPPARISKRVTSRFDAVAELLRGNVSYGSALQIVLGAEQNLRHVIKLAPIIEGVEPIFILCREVHP